MENYRIIKRLCLFTVYIHISIGCNVKNSRNYHAIEVKQTFTELTTEVFYHWQPSKLKEIASEREEHIINLKSRIQISITQTLWDSLNNHDEIIDWEIQLRNAEGEKTNKQTLNICEFK